MKRSLTTSALALLTGLTAFTALSVTANAAPIATTSAAPIPMLVGIGSALSAPLPQAPDSTFRVGVSPLPLALTPLAPLVSRAPGQKQNFKAKGCENCVAITYDDGPVPNTSTLLDILKTKHVHATFFLIGVNAKEYPGIVWRMHKEGHDIGNHSNTHPPLTALSNAGVAKQLDAANDAITSAGAPHPTWMRPPYGATNARVAEIVGGRGQALALWDVDTVDWQHRDASKTCSIAVAQAQARSIILMHDIHLSTVNAAECVIDGLRAKGLRPVSLDELIGAPQVGVTYTSLSDF